jgi:hypothetical protein
MFEHEPTPRAVDGEHADLFAARFDEGGDLVGGELEECLERGHQTLHSRGRNLGGPARVVGVAGQRLREQFFFLFGGAGEIPERVD